MNNIVNDVIQVLDQLKNSGQLNSYLIDDDERKWTKLIYDIMINKFDMPFGNSTMQQASDIFNNAVRVWKGKNKLGNIMNMESKSMNKKLIRLTESDLHRIVKESVNRVLNEIGDTPKGQLALGAVAGRANVRGNRNTEIAASNKAWDNSASGKVRGTHYDSGYELGKDMERDKQQKQYIASRLKEDVIKESVKKVLSELDWRTYANAAKKAGDETIGRIKSGEKFRDLENDKDFTKRARQHNAFRNQAVQGSREKFKDYGGENFDLYTTIGPDDHIYANAEGDNWPNRMVTDKEGKTMMRSFFKPKMVNVKPDRYFGYDKDKISDWNQFSKEINDYNSGKSQYIKGKGWQ